jgi:hypothetical protein
MSALLSNNRSGSDQAAICDLASFATGTSSAVGLDDGGVLRHRRHLS